MFKWFRETFWFKSQDQKLNESRTTSELRRLQLISLDQRNEHLECLVSRHQKKIIELGLQKQALAALVRRGIMVSKQTNDSPNSRIATIQAEIGDFVLPEAKETPDTTLNTDSERYSKWNMTGNSRGKTTLS